MTNITLKCNYKSVPLKLCESLLTFKPIDFDLVNFFCEFVSHHEMVKQPFLGLFKLTQCHAFWIGFCIKKWNLNVIPNISRKEMIQAIFAKAEKINSCTYLVSITVPDFSYLPGQYIKLSCGDSLERYFSISSWGASVTARSLVTLELIIKFNEFLSVSHKIVLEIVAGKEVYISQPYGLAYWRQSDYGNVLIACDSGYSYIRGIAQYIANNHKEQPTLLIWINSTACQYYDAPDIYQLCQTDSNFQFVSLQEDYHLRDISFIRKISHLIDSPHFDKSNFYIGSGNNFYQLLKTELNKLGVNCNRIISDNNG